ncbi:hypothetical protein WDW89_25590 [Deltaproteobacteria bacterium TL4]
MSILSPEQIQALHDYLSEDNVSNSAVVLAPPKLPLTCFPNIIEHLLKTILGQEWGRLSARAQNYLKWMSVKAESVDALAPESPDNPTKGFELLAIDSLGQSFGKIIMTCKELEIPSMMVRFASLIVTFLTLRLLHQHMESSQEDEPSLMYTQNVDADYLNYPRTLKTLLELFPEHQNHFYFEVNENITEDYLNTIRTLSNDLGIRLVLDDSNKMDATVHWKLLDLTDWIKIDFQATAVLEQRLREGKGDHIIWHYERYAQGSKSPVIVLEGLSENSPLKSFLRKNWKHPGTALYYQSRERLPLPPWDKYFGLIQDFMPQEFGLFFKGLLTSTPPSYTTE